MKPVDNSILKYFFPNINEDGWKFISIMVLISIVLNLIWLPLGFISVLFTIWTYYCFRNPIRVTPVLANAVIAPADGTVISITREKGPEELNLQRRNYTRICIYVSLFDAQICRIPLKGKINRLFYVSGKIFSGQFNKNDIRNERLSFILKHNTAIELAMCLTTVFCGNRIKTTLKNNADFLAGQSFGHIRFGGYVDLFLPDKVEPQVCVGQQMIAGETIIADIQSDAPRLAGEIR